MPRPRSLKELKETLRLRYPDDPAAIGEELASRWLVYFELKFAPVIGTKGTKSPLLIADGAKRPDFFAHIQGDDKHVLVLDAKYCEDSHLYSIDDAERKQYQELLKFLRARYPDKAFHLMFMYMVRKPMGQELFWIKESDIESSEGMVRIQQMPTDRLPPGALPALPQPEELKSEFMDELARLMLR